MAAGGSKWPLYGGLAAGVTVVGLAVAGWVTVEPLSRLGAMVGVGLAGASSAFALWLKRRAVKKSLNAALGAVGLVFLARVVLVVVGLFGMMQRGGGTVAFVAGFFGAYFALQWIEIAYVMAESKRRGPGEV